MFTGDGWTDAVAIQGERVVAVGADAEERVGSATRVVSLAGKLALPGFHDAHTHLLGGALAEDGLDLQTASCPEDLARAVADWIAAHGTEGWVTGRGWDADRFPEGHLPRKEDLDRVAPDTPVLLRRRDGHAAVANSRALAISGIGPGLGDPPGGRIVRADGEPTGIVLEDPAIDLIRAHIPPASLERKERAVARLLQRAASLGITTIQDDPSYDDALAPGELYARLHATGVLTARISIWRRLGRDLAELDAETRALSAPAAHVRYGHLKGYLDGSLGSRTAQLFEPYCDDPAAGTGVDLDEAGELFEHVRAASAAGHQVGLHAIGDRAAARSLDAFAACPEARALRHRVEHSQMVCAEDVLRFAELGAVASVQPIHLASDMLIAEARLGDERLPRLFACASFLRAGARLAFGTDYPVEPLAPLPGLACAVGRISPRDTSLAPFVPGEAISLEAALRAYTLGAAEACHRDDELGKLAPGYLADVAVLSHDLTELAPADYGEASCEMTIRGGEVVFDGGS